MAKSEEETRVETMQRLQRTFVEGHRDGTIAISPDGQSALDAGVN